MDVVKATSDSDVSAGPRGPLDGRGRASYPCPVRCPGCSTEIDFSSDTCRGCGVALLELYEKRATGNAARDRRVSDPRSPAALGRKRAALWLAGAAAAAVVFFGLRAQGARPLPEGALTVPGQGFAFVPPAGWAVVSGASTLRLSRGPAAIVVSAKPGTLLPQARQRAPVLAAEAFDGTSVKVLAVSELEVGGRPALRLDVSGERAFLPSAEAGRQLSALQVPAPAFESMELRGALILVEGRGRTHVVKVYSEKSDFERLRPALQAFLEAFRPL